MGGWESGWGLWSGFIDFDGIRENAMVLLRSGFIWVVIGWCRLMMNFPFIIRKFLYIGSRLWYGSWPYFCADFWYGDRVEWCEFWWLVWDYWFLFENGLILLGVLWFWSGILGWFDGMVGFLGSWKLLEIKDFSKVRRSSSRMKIGYFGWEFWVIEGSGREVEIWVVGESGTHSPSGSTDRFF